MLVAVAHHVEQLLLPAQALGQVQAIVVAVALQEVVAVPVVIGAKVRIEAEQRGEHRAEHVRIADLFPVDEQARAVEVHFARQAGERLHYQARAHYDEHVALGKVEQVLPKTFRQTFSFS